MAKEIEIYDCGCISSRPRDPNCKSFGTRWRAYTTTKHIILKCRDCGRMHHFELRKDGLQIMMYDAPEEMTQEEKNELTDSIKPSGDVAPASRRDQRKTLR